MRKVLARVSSTLVYFAILFCFSITTLATGIELGTKVNIIIEDFQIIAHTEDCTIPIGADLDIRVEASRTVSSYKWEVSTDNGVSWTQIAATPSYKIVNSHENTPATVPFKYRITVTNDAGTSDSEIISVLVSNEYEYRTIVLRNGNTDVSSYIHDETRLVAIQLPDNAPATDLLGRELEMGCLSQAVYDVRLVNINDEVRPYFGDIRIQFNVGTRYNDLTLRVFQLLDNKVKVHSGIVIDGILSVTVAELSTFMIEVPDKDTHTINVSTSEGGSATPSGNVNVADGSDKTVVFLPDVGYEISSVTVDNEPVEFKGNSFTFFKITQNHTLNISFRQVQASDILHTVTVNESKHGKVYPSDTIHVRHGSAQTIYFYPDAGYELDTVLINGVEVSVINHCYTLSAVTDSVEVTASFRQGRSQQPNIYKNISASAGAYGSISPSSEVSVEYGGEMYYYFIPDDGYEVDEVYVDGKLVTSSNRFYHFINVIDTHSIHVNFKKSTVQEQPQTAYYMINAGSDTNGIISPSGNVQVKEGGSLTFTFIPNESYEIDCVSVDGVATVISGGSYTFNNVMENHTIYASFKHRVTPRQESPEDYYTVHSESGSNGRISPEGNIQVAVGGRAFFYFLPDEGYEVDTVTVDGQEIETEENLYCFENIDSNHKIRVIFKKTATASKPIDYHIIEASSEGNGSISPSGNIKVADGGSQTFYFIADEGYKVDKIYINDKKTNTVGNSFTIDNIKEDTKIRVRFKPISSMDIWDLNHCIICKYFRRSIAPWCQIIPLMVIIVLSAVLWLCYRRVKNKTKK